MIYFLSALSAFLLAFLLSRHLSNPGSSLYIANHPNHRSLHRESRPRNGGIAIVSGFLFGWMLVWFFENARLSGGGELLFGLAITVVVSFFDDKYSVNPGFRLLIQTCAALVLMLGGFSLHDLLIPGIGRVTLEWFGLPFSILFVVWMMNLYNFMDGMDGFAGGMGAFGFGFLAILGWIAGKTFFFAAALSLSIANIGFLTQNFPAPKSRIFMGDVGSVPLGFLAASLSLWGVRDAIFDFWVPMLIFSPFIVDATVTVIRRFLLGKKIWLSHHSHYYQRLVRFGWSHQRTVLCEYVLMAGFGGTAFFLHVYAGDAVQFVGLVFCVAVYVPMIVLIDRKTENIEFD